LSIAIAYNEKGLAFVGELEFRLPIAAAKFIIKSSLCILLLGFVRHAGFAVWICK
jgi:hypothetical protein